MSRIATYSLDELCNGYPKGDPVEKQEGASQLDIEDIEETKDPIEEDTYEFGQGLPEAQEHYKGTVQPIEIMMHILSHEEFIGFLKGNMIKYAFRAGRKKGESGEKDKEKYRAYKEWLDQMGYFGYIFVEDEEVHPISTEIGVIPKGNF